MIAKCHNKKSGFFVTFTSLSQREVMTSPLLRIAIKKKNQKGASAIEFALVFPLFFLIFYAIISYGMIFVAQQSLTMAAAEGARAALRHVENSSENTIEQARENNARQAAVGPQSVAAWLGTVNLTFQPEPEPCVYDTAPNPADRAQCYRVTVSYPYAQRPLVPVLLGPLMGFAIPQTLSSTAVIQLN
ncbi:TadE/TadG family type IV pilus assembly protein [uncultured Oxalicibacterium sp.]|uniref:TadE/TadG family type IV pilus assembly protein n=1 Tax=uncultured Oxalicibacterium sp. TaxID=1168540 RepID=UPI0025F009F2|nr:TadE/TadG family type IV pilus assembly protein [uncultured Oxalicibacterium sp.]